MHFMGKSSGETKLFLLLGAVILLGGGFLFWSSRPPQPPSLSGSPDAPPGEQPAAKAVTEQVFSTLVRGARHIKGPENAAITIVEFGDFECPACRRSYAAFDPPIEKSGNTRFIFRHLPLAMHERAMPAAIATEAAARQGKFWPMYAALFTGEDTQLTDEYIEESARTIGLNMDKFRTDRADPEIVDLIKADDKLADSNGIHTTPTYIIKNKDGKILSAAGPREMLEAMKQIGLMPANATMPTSPHGASGALPGT